MTDASKATVVPNSGSFNKIDMIERYLALGYALVPLHHITEGRCSCGNRYGDPEHDRKQGGKHPRGLEWQRHPVRDATHWRRYTADNVGIATGRASGIWVLDYDPANAGAGEGSAGAIVERLRAEHWVPYVRTGGAGLHWYFTLPDVEPCFVPTNARGSLPSGLDVRGEGGQVVAPPSVSGKGAYELLTNAGVVASATPAPAWLIEMIRPKTFEPSRFELEVANVPAQGDVRVRRYLEAVLPACREQLAGAGEGTRNETAFRVAARLWSIVRAPWSGLTEQVAYGWYMAGAAACWRGESFEGEAGAVWRNAGKVAEPALFPADVLHGEQLDFPSARSAAVGSNGSAAVTSAVTGGVVTPVTPLVTPSSSPNGSAVTSVTGNVTNLDLDDPFRDPGQRDALAALPLATRSSGEGSTAAADDAVQAMIDRMLTPEQLRALPPPQPLVEGLLDLDTTAWLIGASGAYKSFVALDFACHVGLGREWHGRRVTQGLAVYVVGEGQRGVRLRLDAWERAYGPMRDLLVLPEPVQAADPAAWSVLVAAVARLAGRQRVALIVLDTQARMTIGLKENDNSDMGRYVHAADQLKRVTGACVLTVHHTGRRGADARGASALDGAQDAELAVVRRGELAVTLRNPKQKDQREGADIQLALMVVDGGIDEETGRDLSSLVVSAKDAADVVDDETDGMPIATRRVIALYHMIDRLFSVGDGGSRADIRREFADLPLIRALPSPTARQAWHRAWGELCDRQLIAKRVRSERFKIIPVEDQSSEGVLTRNEAEPTDPEFQLWSKKADDALVSRRSGKT